MTEIICFAGGAVFDASQYAFFGKDVVQEVELGGLEDDDYLPTVESNEEEFVLNREEVDFQSYVDPPFLISDFMWADCFWNVIIFGLCF